MGWSSKGGLWPKDAIVRLCSKYHGKLCRKGFYIVVKRGTCQGLFVAPATTVCARTISPF